MIDFIEYLVSELKSKRLSTTDALLLVKQFSGAGTRSSGVIGIHPLLHTNTSDLFEQSYQSVFSGEEFFLADHQVKFGADASWKVFPGVAYLEMIRAAVGQALPLQLESASLVLRNTVWSQPLLVTEEKQVRVALVPIDDRQVDYEIYTLESASRTIHCQGRAVVDHLDARAKVDVAELKAQMRGRKLEGGSVYAAYKKMGLSYGPAFQAVTTVYRGQHQLLAELRLPLTVESNHSEYWLHPSMMDAAVHASIGLFDEIAEISDQLRLPYALEALRIVSPCTRSMTAWVRYSSGSGPRYDVPKLDVDLFDEQGNVCVQMLGFSSRTSSRVAISSSVTDARMGSLLAVPIWHVNNEKAISQQAESEYARRYIILCEWSGIDATRIQSLIAGSECLSLEAMGSKSIAERYGDYAMSCLRLIQGIFRNKSESSVLVQIAVADTSDHTVFTGLSGLLKAAALENPGFTGQIILVPPQTIEEELVRLLQNDRLRPQDAIIKYDQKARYVLNWQVLPTIEGQPTSAFREQGVYLITGGLGGLGVLFAKEILLQARSAKIILAGRSALTVEKQALLGELSTQAGQLCYRQVDVAQPDQLRKLIVSIQEEHGGLNGILHSAGVVADGFILKKTAAEFAGVLAPKVMGAFNLDEASKDLVLDFMVFFSSIGGAFGNVGQVDYATANAFLDQFAIYRNQLVSNKQRHGRTLSIAWPLWCEGGMGVDAETLKSLQQATGMQPMQTANAMQAFHRSLALQHDRVLVLEGDLTQLERVLLGNAVIVSEPTLANPQLPTSAMREKVHLDSETLREATENYLRRQLSISLRLSSHSIDSQAPLEKYGIDSILAMKLTNRLEKTFGSLSKTLFFEYHTIRELSDYFIAHHSVQLTELFTDKRHDDRQSTPLVAQALSSVAVQSTSSPRFVRQAALVANSTSIADPISIIGLSGRYPEAANLETYWRNLREGKDCITEVPKDRWDWREYFSDDRAEGGRHYSKWGGFIVGVDEFDPLFFSMSPLEAKYIDPQERLFLQHAWMAVEDAGYTRSSLQISYDQDLAGQVGVYVGVMYSEYQLFAAEASLHGRRMGLSGSFASVANRVSYALNVHGPSMTVDTMCSSSLTAIHLACQDLKQKRTSLAIAGGVNVTIHPNKYLMLSAGQFISGDGHCQSFGVGGDGYIPGEGVGALVLKRLSDAVRDGDHIYGVIKGSALSHGGKTSGYTVPNPQAQTSAICRALTEANVDARHVSYIEAHGTGTKLGDPIEIAALSKAFQRYTQDTEFCAIGSAKSNIGHCESAAGIAGLTKVLLQIRYQQIVPSLHSAQLNPHIDFLKTPFVVNQSLRTWDQPTLHGRKLARIAGVSSFGAGGSNAHLIVEEFQPAAGIQHTSRRLESREAVIILLSARTAEQLTERARDLLAFVSQEESPVDLLAIAYTLQVGREPLEERLGFTASSAEQVAEKLKGYLDGNLDLEDTHQGQVQRTQEALSLFSTDADLQQTVDKWIANKKFSKLLELWVKGLELDWNKLYGEIRPRRISLPTYPFARERYWIDPIAREQIAASGTSPTVIHPLLQINTSDLFQQSYRSTFTGSEFFLTHHQVAIDGYRSQKVLPGVAYLEMVRVAVEQSLPTRSESSVLEFQNTVWVRPIVVIENKQVSIALLANSSEQIDYEVYCEDEGQEIVHCQGRVVVGRQARPDKVDIEHLKSQMTRGKLEPSRIYAAFAKMGLSYGPAFQGITALYQGEGQLLAQLRLPRVVEKGLCDYGLHPSLLDGALQASIGLIANLDRPGEPSLPFALDTLRIFSVCTQEMVAWVRHASSGQAEDTVAKLDIDLYDAEGNVCVVMRGFSSRARSKDTRSSVANKAMGVLLAAPVWQPSDAQQSSMQSKLEYVERHILICDLANASSEKLQSLIPGSQCWSLHTARNNSLAERYSEYALSCFEKLQTILAGKPQTKVLIQVVMGNDPEQKLFAGLSGVLKSAAFENRELVGQIIVTEQTVTSEMLASQLEQDSKDSHEAVIKHAGGLRQVPRWQAVAANAGKSAMAFKDQGVYLITGGLGGLGVLFAKEIVSQCANAKVILTGRSVLTAEKQVVLDEISSQRAQCIYRQVDLGNVDQVKQLINSIMEEHRQLNGIIHSAGMTADNFILKKTPAEFSQVLAPKVAGAFNLDRASGHVELDFFVLFSSLASVFGNAGQTDYAAANGFMDRYSEYRNQLVASKQRHGRTLSINWPLWQAGGMTIDQMTKEMLEESTGVQPLQTAKGIQAFHEILDSGYDQVLVLEGDVVRLRRILFGSETIQPGPLRSNAPAERSAEQESASVHARGLLEKAEEYLRKQFSALLELPSHRIDARAPLEKYGIDSILAMRLTNQLEKTFGSLSKTLFFEYQTVAALAGYFVKKHSEVVRKTIGAGELLGKPSTPISVTNKDKRQTSTIRRKNRFVESKADRSMEVAIVGLSGKYPQAENLDQFWENLKSGRDCITEIPLDRWDSRLHYDVDRSKTGKSYSKWGGFIADVDKFDPLFFGISPMEAGLIDPQERLFLETVWETIEDAGYSKDRISTSRVGVFVGAMWSHYELFGVDAMQGNMGIPSSSHASIANRVSYYFNFNGPSIALDTMCSSSLTAIHLACEGIHRGEIDAAIAGGVNVSIHPQKYLSLSQGQFTASDGRCRSFGAGGDGYVPGEGVGAVLLKSLDDALRDQDHVYGVIKSSTINHGGKTNGYTVPNPNAQTELILEALKRANIDPRTLSYVETHGTGTSLGDPIEVTGLLKAFEGYTDDKQFCPIGSVKSNIGHLESAAGIAAITKVLLQFKHGQLVPSLHADTLNPNINFVDSPFYVQTELANWTRPVGHPWRVGVSSFGAGGSNAHLILEEHVDAREWPQRNSGLLDVFVFSARDQDSLLRYARRFVEYLENAEEHSLTNIAHTLQVGRTPLNTRLAVIASSVDELRDKLTHWMNSRPEKEAKSIESSRTDSEDVFSARVDRSQSSAGEIISGEAGRVFVQDLLANRDLVKIAKLWTLGIDVNWSLLHRDVVPKRISLPTYPFSKERCWINSDTSSYVPDRTSKIESTSLPVDREKKQRTYYRPVWSKAPLVASTERELAAGPFLIVGATVDFYDAFRLKSDGGSGESPVVLVLPGNSYEEVAPNVFTVSYEREEDFFKLIGELKARSLLPNFILHKCLAARNLADSTDVSVHLTHGVYSLFYLCKALIKQKHSGSLKILSFFASDGLAAGAENAAISGFLKSLALENPRYLTKVVDLRREFESDPVPLADEVSVVVDEIFDENWITRDIRYSREPMENGFEYARYAKAWSRYDAIDGRTAELPFRQRGVYIVTGGLGSLGMIISEYLAKRFQSRLVLVGRSALSGEQEEKILRLKKHDCEVLYIQADVAKLLDAELIVQKARAHFSKINGVIHIAGVNRDSFILKKTREEMESVIDPKVYGAINLDRATSGEDLEVFVLFSSVAGAMGNAGQCDYAYGNHFLDAFAENRESLRHEQRRSGRTLSINWPFWESGGMSLSQSDIASWEKQVGLSPLPTAQGIEYWEDFLRSDFPQGLALYGVPSKIEAYIAGHSPSLAKNAPAIEKYIDSSALVERTEYYLKMLIGEQTKLSPDRIDSLDRFESLGIDSVMVTRFNASLEKGIGAQPKTLLYQYETVDELARYLIQEARQALTELFDLDDSAVETTGRTAAVAARIGVKAPLLNKEASDRAGVAIIGMHGRYPHSENLNDYWENLKLGKDLVELVPANRWDCEEFYSADTEAVADGKIYCKWGGFLSDHDKFDATFFNISPAEANGIDPQERLFLESVWSAIEDAGYTRDSLKKRFPKGRSANVGVFVGVTTNSYHLLAAQEWSRGNIVTPSALPWSVANRISYFFDFKGPSMPVDTACSSSLVALHLACESLENKECQVAIAGGVNLYLHPAKYHALCQGGMLALQGRCRSFGAGDDGFVPGEGVGTLLLKPLNKAIEDQDHIYGIVAGSAFEHSGRSNGYSAPNPNSQSDLIDYALERAGVNPESISYVEAHGTGTQLGDSLEIVALSQAFGKHSNKKQFCSIGSVKANIGHSESAAGMAGIAKVILQIQHRQLVPTLHSDTVNANIIFDDSPFYLQHELAVWSSSSERPRRALVNSFGAGGVNACVVVEEYKSLEVAVRVQQAGGPYLFVLSARNQQRLQEHANRLLAYLRKEADFDLANFCYTLQIGREPMEERLAIVVSEVKEVVEALRDWEQRRFSARTHRGSVDARQVKRKSSNKDAANFLKATIEAGDLDLLAKMWIEGKPVDWESTYTGRKPRRISLPTYPFARERYWVSDDVIVNSRVAAKQDDQSLHPLISRNSSTLKEVSFSSFLSDNAFYAVDHQVNDEKVFPGAGLLEMACICGNIAGERRVSKIKDIVWIQPLSFRSGPQELRTYLKYIGDNAEYAIASLDEENERIVHSEGRLFFDDGTGHFAETEENLSIQNLRERCSKRQDVSHYYKTLRQHGLYYGSAFQTIEELYSGDFCVLAKLRLADQLKSGFEQFLLHPTIIDGAMQAIGALATGLDSGPYLPFALDEVDLRLPISQSCYAYVEFANSEPRTHSDIRKFNIRLLNERGKVLVKLKNLLVRSASILNANRLAVPIPIPIPIRTF